MIVALGVCTSSDPHHGGLGYMAGMFHLFTHAMFKALLFLVPAASFMPYIPTRCPPSAGLRKYMPITHITFLIACLAIAGIPPFSGFFSKDEILAACFQYSPVMGWVMTIIAAMTAFYMFRLLLRHFLGRCNTRQNSASNRATDAHTPHESPLTHDCSVNLPGCRHLCGRFHSPSKISSVPTVNRIPLIWKVQ